MSLPTITDDDLENVDLTKPLPVEASPILQQDKEKAKLLQAKIGNPIELQQYNAVEIRTVIDQRIKADMESLGFVSDATMEWMKKMNDVLSDLHKNMYGTKSMQVQMQGKITHAQIQSLIRQADTKDQVVDVTPKKDGEQ